MRQPIRTLTLLLATGAAALLPLISPVRADDTEIFVGQTDPNSAAGRSNILFIIDTSGSMNAEVQTQAEWNSATLFTGCYRSDAIYFGTGTQPPPCESQAFIVKAANRCAASRPTLDRLGQYSAFALGWDTVRERWDTLVENSENQLLECEADQGIDGNGGDLFATNGPAGPWGPDDSAAPAWNTQYTVFDGNWLNWRTNPPTVTRSRLQIVQEVVTDIVADLTDVNVGLMAFNFDEGGNVRQAVGNVATTRTAMIAAVNGMVAAGRTPLSETLYEAALYFRGDRVDYGNIGPALSVAASRLNNDPSGERYLPPVSAECQRNFIILLTDGEPIEDVSADAKIAALPDFGTLLGSCDGSGEGACLDDLAEYLQRGDISASLPGQQNIVTYTIGFGGVDTPLLEATARRGGGRYFLADDTGSLAAVMTNVVAGIVERSGTFSAPAIPVGAFNTGATERDAFVSVFQPTGTAHWPGNLKKYRFSDNELVGQDGQAAVDPQTGFFRNDAFSFWSAAPDGERVRDGGAASRLPAPLVRSLYTDLAGPVLTSAENRVAVSNSAITAGILGVTAENRDDLIRWIRGSDVLDTDGDGDAAEPRREMGDPLHARPVTLSYGTSAINPDTVVFITTNDGMLHAVDAATGNELWAYLPGRLLSRQNELLLNPASPLRRYGLDGEIRLFVNNSDGLPGIGTAEQPILFFGMGRGGDAVFAVDVSNRAAPALLWQIDRSSPGFSSIGQVWAAPEVARVNIDGTDTRVVVLTGGYDDSQDNRGFRTDSVGNAVFMVDALTGELLWSAGAPDSGHELELPAMQHSIPAAPRVVDLTGDGLADRLYVGDMGGRLWRFDILNGNNPAGLVAGGVLASLGAADLADPPAREVRRFYATPDVVFVNCNRGNFLAINIGSGYRGHPLDTDVDDAFFSVRDANAFGAIATNAYGTPIAADNLIDITDIPNPDAVIARQIEAARGWRLRMTEDDGEKILSGAITFDSTIFFTSFAPGGTVSACVGGLGVNRAYQVDACYGRPVTNLDGSTEPGPLGVEDRATLLNQTGIAPESVFLFPANAVGDPTRCIGLVCFPPDDGTGQALRRTFWAQEPAR